jgi:hypothetical protein
MYVKKASQIQIFRNFEPLGDFIFIFKICNLGLQNFRKLSLHTNFLERAFLKAFSPKLQILKLIIKSTSDFKILKIWI